MQQEKISKEDVEDQFQALQQVRWLTDRYMHESEHGTKESQLLQIKIEKLKEKLNFSNAQDSLLHLLKVGKVWIAVLG